MNVKQFAHKVGLTGHTVRYYDNLGLFGPLARNPSGHRCFNQQDIDWIAFVLRLKETGMPLEQILQYAHLRAEGDTTLQARLQLLQQHAATLEARLALEQHHLGKLNEKIGYYQRRLLAEKAP